MDGAMLRFEFRGYEYSSTKYEAVESYSIYFTFTRM